MRELALTTNPGGSVKSEVMTRAAELREEGCDPSEALRIAWVEAKEEEDDSYLELDDDSDENELELAEYSPDEDLEIEEYKPLRKGISNPDKGIAGIIMMAGMAYLGWCLFQYSQSQKWSWQPWKPAVPQSFIRKSISGNGSEPELRETWLNDNSSVKLF